MDTAAIIFAVTLCMILVVGLAFPLTIILFVLRKLSKSVKKLVREIKK